MPRNSTTKSSAFVQLRSEIKNLRQEITPMLSMSGSAFRIGTATNSQPIKIHRKIVLTGVADLSTPYELHLQDLFIAMGSGATITKFVVQNLSGRSMTVTCDPTGLVINQTVGANSTVMPTQSRFVSAPMSRFPTCKIDIPDAFGAPSNSSIWTNTQKALIVYGSGSAKETIKVSASYWKLVQ